MEKAARAKAEPGGSPAAAGPNQHAGEKGETGQGKRYGEALKRLVVEQLESGKLTVAQAQRQHGVAGSQTIRAWQARYGKAGGGVRKAGALAAAQAQIERLRREKAELEHALSRSAVKVIVLESAMEEAEARYGEGFKKKSASGPWSGRGDGCARKG